MNHRISLLGLVAALSLATGLYADEKGGHGDHEHGKKLSLPACPVMGEDPIDLSVSVATDDGPVFFCCEGCIEKYVKNPGKYASKVKAQRKALADLPKVQTTCPVSGKPVNQEIFVEYNGKKTYLCCKGCISKFTNDPDKYQTKLANSYSYQTKCPVRGEDIDPKVSMELADGQKIFFCCNGCDKKLTKTPKKYLPNLEAQGIGVTEKQLAGAKHGHGDHKH